MKACPPLTMVNVSRYLATRPGKRAWNWRRLWTDCSRQALIILSAAAMAGGIAVARAAEAPAKVGLLWISAAPRVEHYVRELKEGMLELGWTENRDVYFVERYANGEVGRLPSLAAELVELGVNVLYVTDGALPAARAAAGRIPIVCPDFYDPIAETVTHSMARPDGNVTGVSWQSVESVAKRLQLTQELIPGLKRVGVLFDATDAGAVMEVEALHSEALHIGIDLKSYEIRTVNDFPDVFATLKRAKPQALLISTNPLIFKARDQIVESASALHLPLIGELPEFARAGALLTYGADVLATYRRAAYFVDKILKGAKVADLPIEQPTKFQLVVNLKTAKALRIAVPVSITSTATQVIR